MSLLTTDYDHALSYAYKKAAAHHIPMEIYSRPLVYVAEIDNDTDIDDLQFIVTPNINLEIPDNWTLHAVIGISDYV